MIVAVNDTIVHVHLWWVVAAAILWALIGGFAGAVGEHAGRTWVRRRGVRRIKRQFKAHRDDQPTVLHG